MRYFIGSNPKPYHLLLPNPLAGNKWMDYTSSASSTRQHALYQSIENNKGTTGEFGRELEECGWKSKHGYLRALQTALASTFESTSNALIQLHKIHYTNHILSLCLPSNIFQNRFGNIPYFLGCFYIFVRKTLEEESGRSLRLRVLDIVCILSYNAQSIQHSLHNLRFPCIDL